jgi:hypothetical protein
VSAPAKDKASVLGIRATWTCAECPATAVSRQIAEIEPISGVGVVIVLDPPPDWQAKGDKTYCPEHAPAKKPRRA